MIGRYIVIEGHDGTGKSTQVAKIRQRLSDLGINSIEFHEPAGSPIADEIRTILKNGHLKRDALTDALLFSAARHDIWHNTAIPALKNNTWVIASRNYYSTLAYQGYGDGLDISTINSLTELATDIKYMTPDLAIILSINDEGVRKSRIESRGQLAKPDNFESKSKAFQDKVNDAYIKIAKDKNIIVIDASQTIDSIAEEIWNHTSKIL